jgi:hypothetical protein
MTTVDRVAVEGAAAAIARNNEIRGLEAGNGLSTDAFHLICSLIEFCDYHTLDFDELLGEARQSFAEARS